MSNRCKSALSMVILSLLPFAILFSQTFYVSPDGNDANPGTIEEPLKTFKGSVQAIQNSGGSGEVYFRDGEYVFNETVIINNENCSGSVTFQGYNDERVVFSSLKKVDDWETYQEDIMVADLPHVTEHIRFLQDRSEGWLKRSSSPFFRPAIDSPVGSPEGEHWEPEYQERKTYTEYPSSFNLPDASKAVQYDLRVSMMPWNAQVLPISSINTDNHRINVATSCHYSIVNGMDDLQTECWILNSIGGIDQPGEWACIDGRIYLIPMSGTEDIYAPVLQELIRIDAGGDGNKWSGTPVQNINFNGITFTGCDYRPLQQNDVTAQHDWQMVDVAEGLLRFRNAANCNVTNCKFTKSGGDGIRLDRYAQNITVDNCEFNYLGKGGVLLSGRGPGYGDVNKNNTIINSHFNNTSRIKWDAAALHVDQSSSNLIKHNYFENTPMSAVIVSGCRESNIWEKHWDPNSTVVINRDFHWAEIRPDLVDNPDGAAEHFYDHDNNIEENTFRAVHVGMPDLVPTVVGDPPGFSNGIIYTTGRKAGATDFFNRNYFYDINPGQTECFTWVILGDGHEDYSDFHQNMMYNIKMFSDFEPPPLINQNCNDGGECSATANISLNCTHGGLECEVCGNTHYAGNIDFDSGNPVGSAEYLEAYKEMHNLLSSSKLPGPNPLPGSAQLMDTLYHIINQYDPDWTKLDQFDTGIPATYGLSQNYPNPFNPVSQIKFKLPKASHVTLETFNILGEKVGILIKKEMDVGFHEVIFNASELPSGVYMYKLKAGEYGKTKKCLLVQ